MTDSISDLKYEYERARSFKENLEKNLARKKKLNLIDKYQEEEFMEEIREADRKAEDLRARYRRADSQKERSKIISESNEKAPWE